MSCLLFRYDESQRICAISISMKGLCAIFLFLLCCSAVPDRRQAHSRQFRNSTYTNDGVTIKLVDIPAGNFMMGSPADEFGRGNDEQQHSVTLAAFRIGCYPVTFAQYDVFCEATNRIKPDDNGWGRGLRPVINVSWYDAVAFCEWMGGGCRLPTEAEWEYACRANSVTPFNQGSQLTTNQADYNGTYPYHNGSVDTYWAQTVPVGNFAPNAWGLYDMHGNVLEWCADWYGDYAAEAVKNPRGVPMGDSRVLRGGSWNSGAVYCRSAARIMLMPGYRVNFVGFRVAFD